MVGGAAHLHQLGFAFAANAANELVQFFLGCGLDHVFAMLGREDDVKLKTCNGGCHVGNVVMPERGLSSDHRDYGR
jgi:hypothetical protein